MRQVKPSEKYHSMAKCTLKSRCIGNLTDKGYAIRDPDGGGM